MERLGHAFLVTLLRVFSVLPYSLVARAGSMLGAALYAVPSRRKHIVLVNLRLCFPDKTEREHDDLAKAHFRQVVRSYLERGIQWFGSARAIRNIVQIDSKLDAVACCGTVHPYVE